MCTLNSVHFPEKELKKVPRIRVPQRGGYEENFLLGYNIDITPQKEREKNNS
jgi:hypothetical protein